MSVILRYADVVESNVRGMLFDIEGDQGKIKSSYLRKKIDELQGGWIEDSINVLMVCLEKQPPCKGRATPEEIAILVKKFSSIYEGYIKNILRMRAEREALKNG